MIDGITLHCGDVIDVAKDFPDESFTAVFTDPPYGLSGTPDMVDVLSHWLNGDDYVARGGGFMGKSWDSFVPGPSVWKEVFRLLVPGGVLLVFAGTRTADLLGVAIRLAGFEKFDEIDYLHGGLPPQIEWLYGSGFPKSHDVSKAIDREAGAERKVVGRVKGRGSNSGEGRYNWNNPDDKADRTWYDATVPATPAAHIWAGYGTALKPAHEIILCFRKPREATYAQTAVEHGAGALNIDGCRIETNESTVRTVGRTAADGWGLNKQAGLTRGGNRGRWPANVILDEEAGALLDAQSGYSKTKRIEKPSNCGGTFQTNRGPRGHTDSGGASRFFYCAKANKRERDAGLENSRLYQSNEISGGGGLNTEKADAYQARKSARHNPHPCCKPLALCEYLARLIVPPPEYRDTARLLVPFAGSGSEMIGAVQAGWQNVAGIEISEEYIEIAKQRIAYWCKQGVQDKE